MPNPAEKPYYVARSTIHGRGLFAARRIRKGEVVGHYEGPETMRDGRYVLWVEDEDGKLFGIDGKNDLRFVNHSSRPNTIFYGDELVSLRVIRPGEEITFHYGEDWDDVEDEPMEGPVRQVGGRKSEGRKKEGRAHTAGA